MKKRILALLTAFALLLTNGVYDILPAFAAEPDSGSSEKTVTISDGSEVNNWSYAGQANAFKANQDRTATDPTRSHVVWVSGGRGALRKLTFQPDSPLDLTGGVTLEWDMQTVVGVTKDNYVAGNDLFSEVKDAYQKTMAVALTDGSGKTAVFGCDAWNIGNMDNYKWRHISVSLAGVDIDLSDITEVFFYTARNDSGHSDPLAPTDFPETFFRFDDITATVTSTPEPDPEPEPEGKTVMISNGSEVNNWSYAGQANAFTANQDRTATDPTRNHVVWASGGRGALRKLTFQPDSPLDLTGGVTLEWDMQTVVGVATEGHPMGSDLFDEVKAAYEKTMAVALTDGSGKTAVFPCGTWDIGDVDSYKWRHISVSLAQADVDLSDITEVFFYTARNDSGHNDPLAPTDFPQTFFRFDDITATVTSTPEPAGPLVITDCDSIDGWASEDPQNSGLLVNTSKGIDGGSAIHAQGGWGLLRALTYTAPIDLKENSTLEWDLSTVCGVTGAEGFAQGQEMFETIAKTYGKYIAVEVSDGTNTAVIPLNKWQVSDVLANNYRHFAVSLEGLGLDTAKIASICFYVIKKDAGGAPDQSLPSAVFYRFDNIIATTNPVTPPGYGEPEPTGPILISDGSSTDGWSLERGSLIVNTDNGNPKPSMQVGAGYGALRRLTYTGQLDLTGYPTLEWDWFVMVDGKNEDAFETVLKSYRATTAVEVGDGEKTATLSVSDAWELVGQDGLWRHFAVSLADTGLNLANIKTICFYTCPVDGGQLDTNLPVILYRFDNIQATDKEVTPNMAETGPELPEDGLLLSDCETLDNWSYEQTSQQLGNYPGRNSNGIGVFTGFGSLRRITYTQPADAGLDLTEYHKFGFDFFFTEVSGGADGWEKVKNAYKNYIGVEISDGEHTEKFRLSDMTVTPLDNSWYHAEVEVPSDSMVDLAHFATFTFYALPMGTGNPDQSLPNMNFRIDNLAAYKSAGQPSLKNITGTYFSDGMLFQQSKPMNLFGKAEGGKTVKAELLDHTGKVLETKETQSAEDGAWKLAFDGRTGSYDTYTVKLYLDGALTQVINDILIGELWLTAGQSNMEYYVIQAMETYDTPIPENKYVRFFVEPTVPGGVSAILPATPAEDIPEAFWDDGSVGNNAKYVSAIGYFMSLQLQEKLGVPVGFIHAAKGASLIESWLPRDVIEGSEVIKSTLETRNLYYTPEQLEAKTANWENLTTLYNTRIAPIAGINIAGMLWYQGESNVKYAGEDSENPFYAEAFRNLIEVYSKAFGFENGDMPFVFAHLAPHDYSTAGGRAQDYPVILAYFAEMLSETAEKTGAHVIQLPLYDLSLQYKDPPVNNPDPIHPNSKKAVAERFANAVLAGVYGQGDADAQTAPIVESWKVEGDKIILKFRNVGQSGLKILDGSTDLTGFAIAGADRVFIKAAAKIVGKDTVELSSDAVKTPAAATYAWASFNMRSNLANAAGIPAVPYRTDQTASTYYLSMDWADFDSDRVWVALTTLDSGYQSAYAASQGAALGVETTEKLEGKAAIRLGYALTEKGTAELSPVLNYHGMVNQYPAYTGLTVSVKNPDSRAKQLALKITASGEDYYAAVTTGETLSTTYDLPSGEYASYTFNLTRLVNSDGKVLADSTPVLKTMTAMTFCVTDAGEGSVLFDSAYLRADLLPAPGKDSDEQVEVEDTTSGSLDADGNMWLSAGESTGGWSATGAEVAVDSGKHTQGNSSVGATAAHGVLKQLAFVPGTALDISEYDYLEFDVYFSNLKWFNASNMMFEMTSSGGPDVDSNRWMKGKMTSYAPELYNAAVAESEKPGWYHVKLTIDAPQGNGRGSLDPTHFNFFRFYSIDAPAGTPDYEVRFDNMKFTKQGSGPAEDVDPAYGKVDGGAMWLTDGESLGYWRATGADVLLATAQKTQGSSSVSVTAKNGVLKQLAFVPDKAVNITAYQYLEFDVYFSNLNWYYATDSTMFELTSSGTSDNESSRYTKSSMLEACPAFAADVAAGFGGGKWYHFKLDLDTPHAKVRGGLNKGAFNFFRFYVVDTAPGTQDFTMYLDNLRFTKGQGRPPLEKTDEYIVLNDADSSAGWSSPGQEVMVDTVNKVSGSGAVTVTAKGGILKELVYRPAEAIDLTGYRYLQFDLFLSDITCLNTATGFMVELTSSGACDVASDRYLKTRILAACPELAKDLSDGSVGNKWYHFCFDLEKPQNQARGGLDKTAFNYFRIYFIGSPAGTPDCTVKLDNLTVTVTGVETGGGTPSQGGQIVFPSGGSAGKNVGNKVNGGLLGNPVEPISDGLVKAVAVTGGVTAVLLILAAALLIVLAKQKKRK